MSSSSASSSRSSSHSPSSPTMKREDGAEHLLEVFSTRKAWKKSGTNGERIWPEELEVILIEGLRAFIPDPSSRETTMLGRYPHRNKFISNYILEKTGELRTPKQVGSRLQQLREYGSDSSEQGRMLQKLLSPIPVQKPTEEDNVAADPPVIWIDILPKNVSPSSSTGHARPIHTINPSIAFVSETLPRTAAIASVSTLYDIESQVSVFRAGDTLRFETEEDGRRIYFAPLAPGFWQEIVTCDDPTRYAIDLYVADRHTGKELLRAVYRFQYPSGLPTSVSPTDLESPVWATDAPPTTMAPWQATASSDAMWSQPSNNWHTDAPGWAHTTPDFAPSPTSSSGTDSGWSDNAVATYIATSS